MVFFGNLVIMKAQIIAWRRREVSGRGLDRPSAASRPNRAVACKTPGYCPPAFVTADEALGLSGADSRSCGAALQRSPLILAETAPDTMILTSFQRPLQACVPDIASPANLLGLFNLEKGWAGIPDREEQLRVLVQASGPVAPIHGVTLLTDCSGPLA
jgi:hypothetical protein